MDDPWSVPDDEKGYSIEDGLDLVEEDCSKKTAADDNFSAIWGPYSVYLKEVLICSADLCRVRRAKERFWAVMDRQQNRKHWNREKADSLRACWSRLDPHVARHDFWTRVCRRMMTQISSQMDFTQLSREPLGELVDVVPHVFTPPEQPQATTIGHGAIRSLRASVLMPLWDSDDGSTGMPLPTIKRRLRVLELCCAPGGFAHALLGAAQDATGLLPHYVGVTLPEEEGGVPLTLDKALYAHPELYPPCTPDKYPEEVRSIVDERLWETTGRDGKKRLRLTGGFQPVVRNVMELEPLHLAKVWPPIIGLLYDVVTCDGAWTSGEPAVALTLRLRQIGIALKVLRPGGTVIIRGRTSNLWGDVVCMLQVLFERVRAFKPITGVSTTFQTNGFVFYICEEYRMPTETPLELQSRGGAAVHLRREELVTNITELEDSAEAHDAEPMRRFFEDYFVSPVTSAIYLKLSSLVWDTRTVCCFAGACETATLTLLLPDILSSRLNLDRVKEHLLLPTIDSSQQTRDSTGDADGQESDGGDAPSSSFASWGYELPEPILAIAKRILGIAVERLNAGKAADVENQIRDMTEFTMYEELESHSAVWSDPCCCVQYTSNTSLDNITAEERAVMCADVGKIFELLREPKTEADQHSVVVLLTSKQYLLKKVVNFTPFDTSVDSKLFEVMKSLNEDHKNLEISFLPPAILSTEAMVSVFTKAIQQKHNELLKTLVDDRGNSFDVKPGTIDGRSLLECSDDPFLKSLNLDDFELWEVCRQWQAHYTEEVASQFHQSFPVTRLSSFPLKIRGSLRGIEDCIARLLFTDKFDLTSLLYHHFQGTTELELTWRRKSTTSEIGRT